MEFHTIKNADGRLVEPSFALSEQAMPAFISFSIFNFQLLKAMPAFIFNTFPVSTPYGVMGYELF